MIRTVSLPALIGAVLFAGTLAAQEVEFTFSDDLAVGETQIPYAAMVALRPESATRIGINALLDLREFQAQAQEDLAGETLLDVCGNQTVIEEVTLETQDRLVSLTGRVRSQFYECERLGGGNFQRGAAKELFNLGIAASATAGFEEDCIVFDISDLTLMPEARDSLAEDDPDLQTARVLMLEAVNVVLRKSPVCPELPPELASLDPIFGDGGPREIGEGGLGVDFVGSVDVSTRTILDILQVLQEKEIIPGPP
ncbi:MAG: hypothetical protein AAGF74_06875 [Pseudomonadota bacterium]